MTHTDHDPEEAGLRALFDQSADDLGGPGLTKLKARAADIPLQRRPAWWRLWAPALAVAMGAILVFGIKSMNRPEAATVATAVKTASPAPAPSAVPTEDEPDAELDDSDSLALVDEDEDEDDEVYIDDGSEDLLAFGVPASDDDLDAWLEATDELLGEDG